MENEEKNTELERRIKGLAEVGKDQDLRERWKKVHQKRKRRNSKRLRMVAFAAAASLLLLISLPLLRLNNANITHEARQNLSSIEKGLLEETTFRGEENDSDLLTSAREAVGHQEYKRAVELFEGATMGVSYPDQMLWALAYFQSGNKSEAVRKLNLILEGNSLYQSKAKWILANLHLVDKDKESAIKLLKEIENENAYKARVKELKEKMKAH